MDRRLKLVITDIDGVLTDGGMYYSEHGDELKKFSVSDGAGFIFLKLLDIEVAVITGEKVLLNKNRMKKLRIEHYYPGIKNKLAVANQLCEKLNVSLDETAFIGDDINDIVLLDAVGWSACPENAPSYIKDRVDIRVPIKGGEGAFRAFVEHLLKQENLLTLALERYLSNVKQHND